MSSDDEDSLYQNPISTPEERLKLCSESLAVPQRKYSPLLMRMLIFWKATQILLIGSYLFFVFQYFTHFRDHCLRGTENIYDDPPIEYETVVFHRAGFHDSKHNDHTIYEGRPNVTNNAAWDNLLSVGIATISNDENMNLPSGTAKSLVNPKQHLVEIEMFHQLHCIKALRTQLWEFEDGIRLKENDPTQRQQHFDHCLDYLRQVIMCHGDLTPITFEWNDELSTYLAHHSTQHECRNFEKIFSWSKQRKEMDMEVDGNHQNVELVKPEIFD